MVIGTVGTGKYDMKETCLFIIDLTDSPLFLY